MSLGGGGDSTASQLDGASCDQVVVRKRVGHQLDHRVVAGGAVQDVEARAVCAAMSRSTRATRALQQAGIAFTIHSYDYDPDADRVGLQAAAALGAPPDRVLKTLMALVDGKPARVIVPSDREVSLKRLAAVFGGKSAQMMKPADTQRLSGYKVGGISPFGQMRKIPTAIEAAAPAHDLAYLNGGQRGLQVRLKPQDASAVLGAVVAAVVGLSAAWRLGGAAAAGYKGSTRTGARR